MYLICIYFKLLCLTNYAFKKFMIFTNIRFLKELPVSNVSVKQGDAKIPHILQPIVYKTSDQATMHWYNLMHH